MRDFNQSRRPLSGWGTVVFDLIVDILNSAPSEDELTAVQRKALVPLELNIWANQETLTTPQDLRHPCPQRPLPLHGTALI